MCFLVRAEAQFIDGKYEVEAPYSKLIKQLNGLNLGAVRAITQSHDGYMWLGTDTGFYRYDGYEAKPFPFDPTIGDAKAQTNIIDIVEDNEQVLWLSTFNDGLFRFDPATEQFDAFFQQQDDTNSGGSQHRLLMVFMSMLGDSTLMISTGKGLVLFDTQNHSKRQLVLLDGQQTAVSDNITDKAGNVWIGTINHGVFKYQPQSGEITQFKHEPNQTGSLSSDRVYTLSQGLDGYIRVATKIGVSVIEPNTGLVSRLHSEVPEIEAALKDAVYVVSHDKRGDLWISSYLGGFIKYNIKRDEFSQYPLNTGIVYSVFFDDNNLMWVGGQNGLYKLDLQSIPFKALIGGPSSFAAMFDKNGTPWLVGEKVAIFEEKTLSFKELVYDAEAHKFVVYGDTMYFGQYGQGVSLPWLNFNTFELNRLDRSGDPADEYIVGVIPYREGVLYLLSGLESSDTHGLYQYDKSSPDHRLLLSRTSAKHLLMVAQNQLLISSNIGLELYDLNDGTTKPIKIGERLTQKVDCSFEDQSGRIWLCLSKTGLGLYDRQQQRVEVFDWTESTIRSLVGDDNGDLWLGTSSHLVKFDTDSKKFESFRQINLKDDLAFSRYGSIKLKSGAIIINCADKVLYFHPDDLLPRQATFNSKITELKVLNKVVKPQPSVSNALLTQSITRTDKITLTHDDYLFSLAFASLNYRAPQYQKYAYKMEGLDNDWIHTDAYNRIATYTTLPAGDYTFRVKGSNADGEFNQGTALNITVLAPWWASTTAYVVYVLLTWLLVVLIFALRTKALRRRAKRLSIAVEQRTGQLQRETEKVNQLLADKDRLIANISHEFRTPLTLILGPLENELKNSKNPNAKNMLSLAKSNGQRLLAMVDQLLDITRTKDHTNQSRQLINVAETAVFIVESYRSLVHKHSIILTLDNRLPGPVLLYMQPDSLEKILSNLLTNALKYSADGESVTVTLALTENNQVQLSVKDTGEGISEVDQQQIFERFTRVSNSTKYVPGAGIGLALVKELIDAHHGSISVQSQLTAGSEFIVLLPLAEQGSLLIDETPVMNRSLVLSTVDIFSNEQVSSEDNLPDESMALREHSPLVLVIEDNRDMRRYIVSTLNSHYQCITANDGDAGIEMARNSQPDLIISDVMMPKKDGFEVTRTLKQSDTTNHIPIILLTAHGDEQSRLQGWQEKADEFIEKPFNADQLIGRIDNLLSVRQLLSQRYQRALSLPDQTAAPDIRQLKIEPDESGVNTAHQQFFEQLNQELESNYHDEGFGVKEFAGQMHCSPRQFARKMSTMLDIKPNEALRVFRLKKAAEFLSQGDAAGEVALKVGFASHSYFAQCFKAQYGCMPSQYNGQCG